MSISKISTSRTHSELGASQAEVISAHSLGLILKVNEAYYFALHFEETRMKMQEEEATLSGVTLVKRRLVVDLDAHEAFPIPGCQQLVAQTLVVEKIALKTLPLVSSQVREASFLRDEVIEQLQKLEAFINKPEVFRPIQKTQDFLDDISSLREQPITLARLTDPILVAEHPRIGLQQQEGLLEFGENSLAREPGVTSLTLAPNHKALSLALNLYDTWEKETLEEQKKQTTQGFGEKVSLALGKAPSRMPLADFCA